MTACHAACRVCVTSESVHGKPRARLQRAGAGVIASASIAQASAGVEPALAWQPAGVNAGAFNITAHYTKLPHSLASSLGGPAKPRLDGRGSCNERLCLAPRPSAAASALRTQLNNKSVCSRYAPAQLFMSARCAVWCTCPPARPGALRAPRPLAGRACAGKCMPFRRRTACRAKPLLHPPRGLPVLARYALRYTSTCILIVL
jgi:hypothetical protein